MATITQEADIEITSDEVDGVSGTVADEIADLQADVAALGGGGGPGALLPFDTRFTPTVLYNGSTGVTDQSGNGHDLTCPAGSYAIADILPGQPAIQLASGSRLQAGSSSGYRHAGDVTTLVICRIEEATAVMLYFLSCSGVESSEAEVNNKLYSLRQPAGTIPRQLGQSWERTSSGTNVSPASPGANGDVGLPSPGQIMMVAAVRSGSDSSLFLNGAMISGPDAQTGTATGGGNAILCLGARDTSDTSNVPISFFSVQVVPSALTATQISDEYDRCMAPAFG